MQGCAQWDQDHKQKACVSGAGKDFGRGGEGRPLKTKLLEDM